MKAGGGGVSSSSQWLEETAVARRLAWPLGRGGRTTPPPRVYV